MLPVLHEIAPNRRLAEAPERFRITPLVGGETPGGSCTSGPLHGSLMPTERWEKGAERPSAAWL